MKKAAVQELFSRWRAADPEPKTELLYGNAYQLLVAVVLSAQATDKGVNRATEPLFKTVHTPQEMLALGEARLTEAVKTIGLYRAKVKNVLALSEQLIALHEGEVPRLREELEALPGVGRKTANVVLNALYAEPVIAVDTHVFRVANRLGLSHGATPEAVERDLVRVIPPEFKAYAHHWLLLHGRYICVARTPKCDICPMSDLCPWLASAAGTAKRKSA